MKPQLIWITAFFFMLYNCSAGFSKGIKKDLTTGLSSSYNGFALEDIYLTDAKGNKLSDNIVALGTPLAIEAAGIENFVEKDGKVFPGCTIVLTDKVGKEILNLPDAIAEMKAGTTLSESKVLQANLNTGYPMIIGETYHLKVRFFDKNKKESEIVSNVDLMMKE